MDELEEIDETQEIQETETNQETILEHASIVILKCPMATNEKTVIITGGIENMNDEDLHFYVNNNEQKLFKDKWLVTIPIESGYNTIVLSIKNSTKTIDTVTRTIFGGVLPPILTVNEFPTVTFEQNITLTGVVLDPNSAKKENLLLFVNSKQININDDDTWSHLVNLSQGENEFNVVAIGVGGRKNSIKVSIFHHPDGPHLIFDNLPAISPVKKFEISGRMISSDGQHYNLRIDDRKCHDEHGCFSSKVIISRDINNVDFDIGYKDRVIIRFTRQILFEPSKPDVVIFDYCSPISDTIYKISGSIKDANDRSPKLFVNNDEILYKDNYWETKLPFKIGDNTVNISAINSFGKKTEFTKTFNIKIIQPTIVIEEYPEKVNASTIVVNGYVIDPLNEQLNFHVDQVEYTLQEDNRFSISLDLLEGMNFITLVAVGKNNRFDTKEITINYDSSYREDIDSDTNEDSQ